MICGGEQLLEMQGYRDLQSKSPCKYGPETIPNSHTFHGVIFVTNSRLLNSLC